MMIPTVQMAINVANSFGLITFFSMMRDGRLSVVTAIIKLRIVPRSAPFKGVPLPRGLFRRYPRTSELRSMLQNYSRMDYGTSTVCIQLSGIQSWITAPIATPTRIYGNTFLKVDIT